MHKFMFVLVVGVLIALNMATSWHVNCRVDAMASLIASLKGLQVKLPTGLEAKLERDMQTAVASASSNLTSGVGKLEKEIANSANATLAAISNRFATVAGKMESDVAYAMSAVTRICERHEELRKMRAEEAEAAFRMYEADPTIEVAVLYLQIAIRKNPNELKYIRQLKKVVEDNGMASELLQEYRAMLSYCLDEAQFGQMHELAQMVAELRSHIVQETQNREKVEESFNAQRVSDLVDELAQKPLDLSFGKSAQEISARRVAIYRELEDMQSDAATNRPDRLAAEHVNVIASMGVRVDRLLGQVCRAVDVVRSGDVRNEADLRESLEVLTGGSVTQPLALAQQSVASLWTLDCSGLPAGSATACRNEMERLGGCFQEMLVEVEKVKAQKMLDFVDAFASTTSTNLTMRIKLCEEQAKLLVKYIGSIADAEVSQGVVDRQMKILEESRKLQQERMKLYQVSAHGKMKGIARKIREYKDQWSRQKTKKNHAKELLRSLVTIDSSLLVPEMYELYQYEYAQLTADFNAWVEGEKAYEHKAEFMDELANVAKMTLEEL